MATDTSRFAFFAVSREENASHLIGKAERLVTSLGSSQADLKSVVEALTTAKALYAAREFGKAAALAKRANALAETLNERFNAYMASWKALQVCREELESIGYPADALEEALAAADKAVALPVEEDGAVVGDYLGATALLDRAMEGAQALVVHARRASREIFLATLAVEALSEPEIPQTASWIAARLEQLIEQATRELATGNLHAAHTLATEARVRAEEARAGVARAQELLEEAEVVTEHLGAEGPVADRLEDRIGSVREAFQKGFVDSATAKLVVRRLSDDAISFADTYARSRRALTQAEGVYARLQKEGFFSYEVDGLLLQARVALGASDWPVMREALHRVSQAFVRRRSERDALGKSIEEIRERVDLLGGFGLPLLPDVEEILGRAREEFVNGQYSGASEDVLLARALMQEATRTGSGPQAPPSPVV